MPEKQRQLEENDWQQIPHDWQQNMQKRYKWFRKKLNSFKMREIKLFSGEILQPFGLSVPLGAELCCLGGVPLAHCKRPEVPSH